jgi:hypothetical protein
MINLLLLGQLPGTSIQITFWGWLLLSGFIVGLFVILRRQRIEQKIWRAILLMDFVISSHRRLKTTHWDQIAL